MAKKKQTKNTDNDLVKKEHSFVNNLESEKNRTRESKKRKQNNTKNLDKTNHYEFNFDEKRLSSTETLDTSFLEGRLRANFLNKEREQKEKKKNKTKRLQKERINRPFLDVAKIMGYFIIVLAIALGGLFGFYLSHTFFPTIQVEERIVTEEKKVVDDNYLFLGDSITDFYDLDKYYEELPVVNSGIAGNTTEDILKDMKNRVYRYNPSKIFILIGTNDYQLAKGIDSIKENLPKIIDGIQKNRPLAKIYIESIYPINRTKDSKIDLKMVGVRTNEDIQQGNEYIKELAKEKNITYIDLYSILYDEEDEGLKLEYTEEGLHISKEGYEVITKEIKKYLN